MGQQFILEIQRQHIPDLRRETGGIPGALVVKTVVHPADAGKSMVADQCRQAKKHAKHGQVTILFFEAEAKPTTLALVYPSAVRRYRWPGILRKNDVAGR